MGMAWLPGLPSLWHNVEALTCSGFFCLFLLSCALVILWLDRMSSKASGEGRGRSRCALPLLIPLLLFSSFSFGSSSLYSSYQCSVNGGGLFSVSSLSGVCQHWISSATGTALVGSFTCVDAGVSYSARCSGVGSPISCVPSSSEPVVSSGMGQDGRSITGNFCDANTGCVSSYFPNSSGGDTLVTSGSACVSCGSGFDISASGSCVAVTASASSTPATSCPSGFSVSSDGCSCVSGSSYVAPSPLPSSCTPVGDPTVPTLSPVAPVTSNGVTSCPAGSSSVSSGSSTSCYTVVVPPSTNFSSSGTASGGGGGGSSYHLVAPVTSSNGQLTCQAGQSSIMSSSGSLECIASGAGTAPTASAGSGTAPTGSTSSAPSYPTSISMPSLPSVSVVTAALATIPSAQESTSETCPAPVTFSVMGHTFSITFSYACTLAGQVRPIVIGVFSLASLLLIVK